MTVTSVPGPAITGAGDAPGRRPRATLRLAVLAAIAVAALVHVPFPFWGDQALFTYAAHAMRHGDRLYVDIWDYKQPGIFLWYLGAGSLFGFHEAGIHVAELIWSVALALCTQRMMRDRVEHRWVADIAPLFTVGAFYAAARAWDLTQIEYLVAFPMMLSLWAAADAGDADGPRRTRRLLLSGVMASVVVYFKLVYVLVPLGFWLYLLTDRRRREHARDTARDALVLTGGLAAPLLPLLAYFLSEHLLGTIWWTYITYPPKIVRSIDPPPFSRLRDGVWFFVRSFAWLVPLASAGLGRVRSKRNRRADPLVVGLVIWFVVGWGTVLVQNQWGYQFMLPLVPLGLLAVYGVDQLVSAWLRSSRASNGGAGRRVPAVLLVVAAILAAYPAKQAAHAVKSLVSDDLTLTTAGRRRFEASFEPYYPEARAAAAFVRQPGRTPGPIHVEGNPLIQYLSGRTYALREHGWAPEQSDARLWKWTQDGLRDKRPVYLWVDDFSAGIMRSRSPATLTLINAMYCPVDRVADGRWYALRGSRECSVKQ
jgi:Dolichyl-phosphate-mannose-protein mannosyltransferase